MEYSKGKLNQLLETENFHLKKKFGQNFIIDENTIDNIVKKANIDKNTLVIEIGPGAGSLTQKLAQQAKNVLCYEIDESLKAVLEKTLQDKTNIDIIYQDFLQANVLQDIQKYDCEQVNVVANLPYYITTPIVMKIIEENIPVDTIVIMVQKEVGDRFKATPGNKEYSSLSVYLQYFFTVEKVLNVSRNVFLPKPNVDSIVLELRRKEQSNLKNREFFFQLVRDSFKQKRKTLKNNLKQYDLSKIETVLHNHGYDLSVRAEQLSGDIFVEIANQYFL